MKNSLFVSQIAIGAITGLVLFAFGFVANDITFAQNQFRKPSQNDIEWLFGNNSNSKLPNRNTINYYENAENDNDSTTQVTFKSYYNNNNSPEPCKPVNCSKNGVKLKNPNCKCEYCYSGKSHDVEPCGKVKSKTKISSQKIKQKKSATVPQSLNDSNSYSPESENNAESTSDSAESPSFSDSESDNDEQTNSPVVAVDPNLSIQTNVVNITQENQSPKQATIQFAKQKPTPIETNSEQTVSSNVIKIAYPESDSIQLKAPLNNAIALTVPRKHQHSQQLKQQQPISIPPAPVTSKQLKNQVESNVSCDCGGTQNNATTNNYSCSPNENYHGENCLCDSCEQQLAGCGSGEIIAETCIGVLYRHIAKLRYARMRHNSNHNGQCNCWLCANLDNPDMTGVGIWNYRTAGFGINTINIAANIAALHESPNMFLSRPDIAIHFNAETRNRVWADYRQFNNSIATAIRLPNGNIIYQDRTTNLFTFGFEKCIGAQSSLEARIPLIYQVDSKSELTNGRQNLLHAGNNELGNITLSSKYVFARTKKITLTTGLGVSLPTAENWKITNYNASNYNASIENKAYDLVPYLAVQWHPTDSAFGHLLVQADIPISKNEIQFTNQKSKIEESQLIQVGVQLGRWFYRNEYGIYSCRIGGFVEINYAAEINSADNAILIDADNYVWLNSPDNKPDRLNFSAGLPISFGQFSINNAVIVPLSNDHRFSIAYNFSLCRKF
jgi:hypothetical protein